VACDYGFTKGELPVTDTTALSSVSADGARTQTDAERQLAELIVATLRLEAAPKEIIPDQPLFGAGLGLDSIDALELALAVSRAYGLELRSDDERNFQIFASLASLSRHIESHGAHPPQSTPPAPR
jgi:acyl carrier protein